MLNTGKVKISLFVSARQQGICLHLLEPANEQRSQGRTNASSFGR
jgi:hypothetical protein